MLWIPGANGLLGTALCKIADAIPTGKELNIANPEAIRSFLKNHKNVSHIINCAAFSQVDAAEERKDEAFEANAKGPKVLAEEARAFGVKLIHISTDYVFAGDVKRPLKETDPTGPCNYYGITKLEGEKGPPCVIRTSWIFGSGGKNFVAKLFDMLMTQKEIRLVNDQWGRPTYVHDLAKNLLHMLDKTGLYQYANSGVTTKYEFALAMRDEAKRLGFPVVTESILPVSSANFPSPCKRPVYSAFDTTKIEPFVAIRPWQEALREFLCEKRHAFL